MLEDYLRTFMFEDLPVKGSFVRLSKSWQEVMLRAQPDQVTLSLLGETLCASVLLTSNIKFSGSVCLQIQSAGLMRLLLAQCTHSGLIRGVVRMCEKPGFPLIEQGVLAINLEPDNNGTPYQGIVEMSAEGLVPSLERYFLQSEQIETRFWLVADSRECSGLMLQRLPEKLDDMDDWERLQLLAASISYAELQSCEVEELLPKLFSEDNIRVFNSSQVQFGCSCSLERVSGMLLSLGQVEILTLIQERGSVEVKCEYCGKNYEFDAANAAALFSKTSKSQQGIRSSH